MSYSEARGLTLSREKQKPGLNHLRIFGHADSSAEKPMWLVEHHRSSSDRTPETHVFDDGSEMLRHVAEHADVPAPKDGEQ
jgi:hypothetical protein